MSNPRSTRRWIVASQPGDQVKAENFRLETREVPTPADGEFGIETEYLIVNPPAVIVLNRGHNSSGAIPVGNPMWGIGIGRVVNSRNPKYADGEHVMGQLGWSEYNVTDGKRLPVQRISTPAGVPITARLHILGTTGATAYFGLYDFGVPRIGETILVSAAAGSVGSAVCQLARLSGCRVVALAGTEEKLQWLRDKIGVDVAINYKREDLAAEIRAHCPDGIHIYFDNVGGRVLDAALDNLAMGARVVICGGTSQYDTSAPFNGPARYFALVHAQAVMKGFHITQFGPRMGEAMARLTPLVAAGKLIFAEDHLTGLESAPEALLRVLAGSNFGTQIVRF